MDEKTTILNAKSPYETLLLPTTATPEEAKYQYFKLVKRYSPEKEEIVFRKIRRAYDDLRNPAKKAAVDVMTFSGPPGRVRFSGINTSATSLVKLNRIIDEFNRNDGDDHEKKKLLLETLKLRVVLQAKNKHWAEALADLDRIEEQTGSSKEINDNRIFLLSRIALDMAEKGLYADAGLRWKRALRLDPNRSDILHNIAVCATLLLNREEENRYWVDTLRAWHQDLSNKGDDPYLKNLILETHRRFGGRFLNQTGDNALRAQMHPVSEKEKQEIHAMADSNSSHTPVTKGTVTPHVAPAPSTQTPVHADKNAATGIEAYNNQNWAGAISSFEIYLKTDPTDGEITDKLAWAYLKSGQDNRAFAIWKKMIFDGINKEKALASWTHAKLDTARKLRKRKMINPAMVQLKEIIQLVPDNAEAYKELAEIHEEMQEWVNASYYYEKSLEFNPGDKNARAQWKIVQRKSRTGGKLR